MIVIGLVKYDFVLDILTRIISDRKDAEECS